MIKKVAAVAAVAGGLVLAGAGLAAADAQGAAIGSNGVLSGNVAQTPVYAPVNVCGNTVNANGLLNPAVGNNICINK